jgi:outer membrane protein assembly factor BamB
LGKVHEKPKQNPFASGLFLHYLKAMQELLMMNFSGGTRRSIFLVGGLAALLLAQTPAGQAQDWLQWRGPNRDGRSTETGLLKQWPEGGPKQVWKATGLGAGYSGLTVAGDRVYTSGDHGDASFVLALDRASGNKVWSVKLGKSGAPGWGNFAGPRGSVTIDGDRLYAMGQYGEVVCLQAKDGKEIWRKHMVHDFGAKQPEWGYSESPLVDGEQVVMTPGGSKGAVVALNKMTGAQLWQSKDCTDEAHYSSLVISEFGGVRHYVQLTADHVIGVNAKDGSLLWKAVRKGKTAVIPTPEVHEDMVFVTSGYGVGCNLFKITKSGSSFSAEQVYANKDLENHHGGTVFHQGNVYGHSESRGWVCLELKTGKLLWREKEKLRKGSILFADGHLYLREEADKGTVALIEASPEGYKESGRFAQPDRSDKNSWPHPVIANGKLYLRDQDILLCYDIKGQ